MNFMLSNLNDSGDSVCCFTESEDISSFAERGFRALGVNFADAFVVRDEELQYYSYEPLWLTSAQIERLRAAANS